jgi:hypothetical protein
MQVNKLEIQHQLWQQLVHDLRARGGNKRESGAVLLAKNASREIVHFICYDDLDPHAFDSGIVRFDSSGFVPLWKICHEQSMSVVADVHTHPDKWTGQSSSDQGHPIIHQIGHIAMIIPYYAQKDHASLRGIGLYEYRGGHEWKTIRNKSRTFKIIKK